MFHLKVSRNGQIGTRNMEKICSFCGCSYSPDRASGAGNSPNNVDKGTVRASGGAETLTVPLCPPKRLGEISNKGIGNFRPGHAACIEVKYKSLLVLDRILLDVIEHLHNGTCGIGNECVLVPIYDEVINPHGLGIPHPGARPAAGGHGQNPGPVWEKGEKGTVGTVRVSGGNSDCPLKPYPAETLTVPLSLIRRWIGYVLLCGGAAPSTWVMMNIPHSCRGPTHRETGQVHR
jgi:hypothetical protein